MKIDNSVPKSSGTATQIQLPHSGKALIKNCNDLISVSLKVGIPVNQSLIIMSSKTLHIYCIKSLRSPASDIISRRLGITPPGNMYFLIHASLGYSLRELIK